MVKWNFFLFVAPVHDEAKTEPQIKPAMFVCNPELSMNVTQPEMSQPMVIKSDSQEFSPDTDI